ncbi:hypothetical protein I6F65_12015 [Pseudoalteromonas sp. SWXJZ94C]|uniref:hypothetical protein n=1 Tax=Pseudoalteromonas sp. MM1 TaxID=3036714 RepID=UPI001A1D793F|nr:hypothetical protein [Pseudoalteromonas sp. MM1]MBH0057689.1 hypothetical protein [Pseudoalteromonas sp. SWXJZ94C]BED87678.1 hypothetical protein PspMM1_01460 [Pseudoalteromonas sp. MM1]
MLKAGLDVIVELSALLITFILVQVYFGGLGLNSFIVSVIVFLSALVFMKVCIYYIGKIINAKKA